MSPRCSNPLVYVAAIFLASLACSCGREQRTIRIATGTRGGTFLPLGETLARSFERDVPELDFVALESPGGLASIEMIERGEADLALLSNHVEGSSALRLVAPLYRETLQLVVRRDAGIETLLDLRGRALSTGPSGSGTETTAHAVLGHFGVLPAEVRGQHLTMTEAREALEAGRIDAAFIVAGMRRATCASLTRRSGRDRLGPRGHPDRCAVLHRQRDPRTRLRNAARGARRDGERRGAPSGWIRSWSIGSPNPSSRTRPNRARATPSRSPRRALRSQRLALRSPRRSRPVPEAPRAHAPPAIQG